MKFRIIKYYERYKAQVYDGKFFDGRKWREDWIGIGSPTGYPDVESAKKSCEAHKKGQENRIVEEFEL